MTDARFDEQAVQDGALPFTETHSLALIHSVRSQHNFGSNTPIAQTIKAVEVYLNANPTSAQAGLAVADVQPLRDTYPFGSLAVIHSPATTSNPP